MKNEATLQTDGKDDQLSAPIGELSTRMQKEIRDKLVERILREVSEPGHSVSVGELLDKIAFEYSRPRHEIYYVLQYMINKRAISEHERMLTKGSGISKEGVKV